MSKIKLTFTLPDETIEAQTAMDAGKWKSVVWDLNKELRGKLKHSELTESEYEVYGKVLESIFEKIDNAELSLD